MKLSEDIMKQCPTALLCRCTMSRPRVVARFNHFGSGLPESNSTGGNGCLPEDGSGKIFWDSAGCIAGCP